MTAKLEALIRGNLELSCSCKRWAAACIADLATRKALSGLEPEIQNDYDEVMEMLDKILIASGLHYEIAKRMIAEPPRLSELRGRWLDATIDTTLLIALVSSREIDKVIPEDPELIRQESATISKQLADLRRKFDDAVSSPL